MRKSSDSIKMQDDKFSNERNSCVVFWLNEDRKSKIGYQASMINRIKGKALTQMNILTTIRGYRIK